MTRRRNAAYARRGGPLARGAGVFAAVEGSAGPALALGSLLDVGATLAVAAGIRDAVAAGG
ncbi:MAG: hypothetical protein ACJ77V_02160, partial [Chloroflexota bacterium]